MPRVDFKIAIDTSELIADLEAIEDGLLTFPTVSAVRVIGLREPEEIPIYLEGE